MSHAEAVGQRTLRGVVEENETRKNSSKNFALFVGPYVMDDTYLVKKAVFEKTMFPIVDLITTSSPFSESP